MKKTKKWVAFMLSLLMVLSSTMTAFAGTSAPAKVTLKSAKYNKRDYLIVKWNKVSKNCKGYEIQYADDSTLKNEVTTVTVKSSKTTSKVIKNVKDTRQTYQWAYVRVRAFNEVKGKKVYGAWSKTKIAKTQRNQTAVHYLRLYPVLSKLPEQKLELSDERTDSSAYGYIQALAPNDYYYVYIYANDHGVRSVTMEVQEKSNGDFKAEAIIETGLEDGDWGINHNTDELDSMVITSFNPLKELGCPTDLTYSYRYLSDYGKIYYNGMDDRDYYQALILSAAMAYWDIMLIKDTDYQLKDLGFANMEEIPL